MRKFLPHWEQGQAGTLDLLRYRVSIHSSKYIYLSLAYSLPPALYVARKLLFKDKEKYNPYLYVLGIVENCLATDVEATLLMNNLRFITTF